MKIGPYEVLGELGRGGMGVVYRVRAREGREAALKLLLRADAGTFARFDRERRLLASLGEGEGFVGLLEAGTSPEGAWLVMPFVPGGTLAKRLEAGPLGVGETVALGLALARALGAAHGKGIVHRDVKPENVLFTASGRPLLADLGLAKHFDRGAPGASQSMSMTGHGVFKGTAGYVAPEQLEDASSAGPPADVFALGAVLYECLAGRPAFPGTTVLDISAKLSSGIVEAIERPGIPPWLEKVVRRALAPDPRARFADGAALARALQGGANGARRVPRAPLFLGAVLGLGVVAAVLLAARPAGSVERSPPRKPPLANAARLVELGEEKFRSGDLDGALAALTKAIELDPGLVRAWLERGLARGAKGDKEGEIADLTRAIELDPASTRAWMERGGTRGNKGDLDGAMADETRAIELDPGFARAWANRGGVRYQKGDLEGALSDLTRAVDLDPELALARVNRGIVRYKMGDFAGAAADLERALELDPGSPRADDTRRFLEDARQRAR